MAKEFDVHAKVNVTGHTGLVGSAIVPRLAAEGFSNALTSPRLQLDAARAHALRGA